MVDLQKIKSSGYFKTVSLNAGDILFSEWDINENLYIIYDGELIVEKSINTKKWEFKILGRLGIWNIVWESALSNSNPKEVQIKANRTTQLLYIEWKNDFPKFVKKFPTVGYDLFVSIIEISNSRLLRANSEVTANYEVNMAISKINLDRDMLIIHILKNMG